MPSFFRKLRDRAYPFAVPAGLTFPDRQGRTPVTLTAQCPLDVSGKPIAKATFLRMLRHPVNRVIESYQLITVGACADIPGLAHVIQQWRVTAPAKRVGM